VKLLTQAGGAAETTKCCAHRETDAWWGERARRERGLLSPGSANGAASRGGFRGSRRGAHNTTHRLLRSSFRR
jgi:hypothetical protein